MKWIANKLTGYNSSNQSIGKYLRKKRMKLFKKMIEKVFLSKGIVNILDIGGTVQYWKIIDREFLKKNKVSITLLNLPNSQINHGDSNFFFIEGDATTNIWEKINMNNFNLIHSNSVIEHVGNWEKMKSFANNIKVFKGDYYIQTPNFWFPIEPHCMTPFFQFFPLPLKIKLVSKFALGHWEKAKDVSHAMEIIESANLLNFAMISNLFEDSKIIKEKFLFLNKSFIAIRN